MEVNLMPATTSNLMLIVQPAMQKKRERERQKEKMKEKRNQQLSYENFAGIKYKIRSTFVSNPKFD